MFVRFPAILLVKAIDSYLHELCTEVFVIETWRNVKEHAIESRVMSL